MLKVREDLRERKSAELKFMAKKGDSNSDKPKNRPLSAASRVNTKNPK